MGRHKISFRLAIALMLAIVLFVTAALQTWAHRRLTDELVNREGERLLATLTNATSKFLQEFLDEPFRIQREVAFAIENHGLYQSGDIAPLQTHLKKIYSELYGRQLQLSMLSFGSTEGEFVGFRRESDPHHFTLMLKDKSTSGNLKIFEGDLPIRAKLEIKNYDPRVRPWYVVAEQVRKPVWSSIYVNADERAELAMTATSPVFIGNRFVGVTGGDVKLDGISQFLRKQSFHGSGVIFIIDRAGRVVASSEKLVPVGQGNNNPVTAPFRPGIESPNPLVRTAAQSAAQFGAGQGGSFTLESEDHPYFGRVAAFGDPKGIDWKIVAVVSERDLLGEARSARNNAVLAIAAMALLPFVFGLWGAHRLTISMRETAEAVRQWAKGDWSTRIKIRPRVREVNQLLDSFNEMAEQIKGLFLELEVQLQYDPLTGLLTTKGLHDEVNWVEPIRGALCLVSLNTFRTINDQMGAESGNQLLVAVASRLRASVSKTVYVARVGDHEFALLFVGADVHETTMSQGALVENLFATPFSAGDDEVKLTVSLGLDSGQLSGPDLAQWLRNAGVALSDAKRSGHVAIYSPELMGRAHERARLAQGLHDAILKRELLVEYQPVIQLSDGRVVGAEALVRWRSPAYGMVSPANFVPIAEESDLILKIGEWVLRQSATEVVQWMKVWKKDFELHVNLSARQLIQSDVVETISGILHETGLAPQSLTLELTESVLVHFDQATIHSLGRLRQMGVKVAIDDFGTGYSSLAYLAQLPFDCLKIDQSFIRHLGDTRQSIAVVDAILHMAHAYEAQVVAEGIENQALAQRLLDMGCAYGQGYWFGRPAPLAKLDMSRRHFV